MDKKRREGKVWLGIFILVWSLGLGNCEICDAKKCLQETGIRCCQENGTCAKNPQECIFCDDNIRCQTEKIKPITFRGKKWPTITLPQIVLNGQEFEDICIPEDCEFKCCIKNVCGKKRTCEAQDQSFSLVYWLMGFVVLCFFLAFFLCMCILARRRARLAQIHYGESSPYFQRR
eukprot:TRINITY_DN8738_c0_g1_i1.p1 TRINITY_DN8738_c0_g1~~TRINITY_DN8738_c0_g1_i1.p1  ORF type:complete len:175 (+),score=21.47 TRINITY_DN8738_c0_g1_i1:130-654(+)